MKLFEYAEPCSCPKNQCLLKEKRQEECESYLARFQSVQLLYCPVCRKPLLHLDKICKECGRRSKR